MMSTTTDTAATNHAPYAPWREEPENHRAWVMRIYGRGGRIRSAMPYGCWTAADGRQVLFNRDYIPILERSAPGQPADPADALEWVPWVEQIWFFNDANPPWIDRATKKRCEAILAEWSNPGRGGF
jgi:hypothetical protein